LGQLPIDAKDGFSPREIALLAVVANPGLRTIRDNRGIAHAQVIAAGLVPNPSLSLQGYAPVAGQTSGNVVGFSGQLNYSLQQFFSRGARVDSATLQEKRVELDITWSEWQIAMQAQLLACQLVLQRKAVEIHERNITQLEDLLAPLRHAAEAGNTTETQLASTESVVAQARVAKIGAQRSVSVSHENLRGLLGGAEGIVDQLDVDLPELPDLWQLEREHLLASLTDRRADLRAMEIAMKSQDAAYRAATTNAFSNLQVGLQVARDPGNFLAIGPSLQIGLPVFAQAQAGHAAARSQTQRLEDLFLERTNQARQRIFASLADGRGAHAIVTVLDEAIQRQDHVVDIFARAREEDFADILVFYAARSQLIQLQLQRLTELSRLWQSVITIQTESGFFDLQATHGGA
jgi:outer membrane protein TolC